MSHQFASINRGIARLWQIGREGKVPPGVREIEFFANADDSKMLIEISASSDTRRAAARSWAEDFLASMSEIAGIVVFRENSRGTDSIRQKNLSPSVPTILLIRPKQQPTGSAPDLFSKPTAT